MTSNYVVAAILLTALSTISLAQDQTANIEESGSAPTVNATDATPKIEKVTDRNHPDYVHCRKEPIIGSRAKHRKVCMTNAEWKLAARKGNEGTRSIIESSQAGFLGGN